ncbi:MAG: hypothetical protein ACLTK5_11545 [Clostridium sp.]
MKKLNITKVILTAYYVYRTAFDYFEMGYANTLAWALFVLVFIVTLVQWKMQAKFSNE